LNNLATALSSSRQNVFQTPNCQSIARAAEERLELGAQHHVDFRHRHGQTEIGEACDAVALI
jgi:hypothetical protein